MSQSHPALDWLARRRAGESAALVAHRAGVSQETVERATKPYGPFPRASQHLGRTQLSDEALSERSRRWIETRRRGVLAADIAAAEGVSHQIVSRSTVEHGPFPAVDVVEAWVEARHAGRSLSAIAEEAGQDVAPAAATRDWPGEQRYWDAVMTGRLDRLREARQAYNVAVEKAAESWTAASMAEVDRARSVAVKAVRTAAEAATALEAAVGAAHALGTAADPQARATLPWHPAVVHEALEVVLSEIDSDVWTQPDGLLDRPVGPSRMTYGERRQIAQRNQWDVSAAQQQRWAGLLEIERSEGWKYTRAGYPKASQP